MNFRSWRDGRRRTLFRIWLSRKRFGMTRWKKVLLRLKHTGVLLMLISVILANGPIYSKMTVLRRRIRSVGIPVPVGGNAVSQTLLQILSLLPKLPIVYADNFYPSGESMLCEMYTGVTITYEQTPPGCPSGTKHDCIDYDPGLLRGVNYAWTQSHRYSDIASIPLLSRRGDVASYVAAPPGTKVGFHFFGENHATHDIYIDKVAIPLARENPTLGDFTRLGASAVTSPVVYRSIGVNHTMTAKKHISGPIGTYAPHQTGPGRLAYEFTLSQPMRLHSRNISYHFAGNDLVVQVGTTVENDSEYFLHQVVVRNNIGIYDWMYNNDYRPHQRRTFVHTINMGTNYTADMTLAPTRIVDNNRHSEKVLLPQDNINQVIPETQSVLTSRNDVPAPANWHKYQLTLGALRNVGSTDHFFQIDLLPYTYYSGATQIHVDAVCGDGAWQFPIGEECEDGNRIDGDGCDLNCKLEYCGDGKVQVGLGESCDDGNTDENDGCTSTCQTEYCGDGVLQVGLGEQCDDGNDKDGDGCDMNCRSEYCGDGVIQNELGEECDDGGTQDGDGCSARCKNEFCGDGVVQEYLGEQCDGEVTCDEVCRWRSGGSKNGTGRGKKTDILGVTFTDARSGNRKNDNEDTRSTILARSGYALSWYMAVAGGIVLMVLGKLTYR